MGKKKLGRAGKSKSAKRLLERFGSLMDPFLQEQEELVERMLKGMTDLLDLHNSNELGALCGAFAIDYLYLTSKERKNAVLEKIMEGTDPYEHEKNFKMILDRVWEGTLFEYCRNLGVPLHTHENDPRPIILLNWRTGGTGTAGGLPKSFTPQYLERTGLKRLGMKVSDDLEKKIKKINLMEVGIKETERKVRSEHNYRNIMVYFSSMHNLREFEDEFRRSLVNEVEMMRARALHADESMALLTSQLEELEHRYNSTGEHFAQQTAAAETAVETLLTSGANDDRATSEGLMRFLQQDVVADGGAPFVSNLFEQAASANTVEAVDKEQEDGLPRQGRSRLSAVEQAAADEAAQEAAEAGDSRIPRLRKRIVPIPKMTATGRPITDLENAFLRYRKYYHARLRGKEDEAAELQDRLQRTCDVLDEVEEDRARQNARARGAEQRNEELEQRVQDLMAELSRHKEDANQQVDQARAETIGVRMEMQNFKDKLYTVVQPALLNGLALIEPPALQPLCSPNPSTAGGGSRGGGGGGASSRGLSASSIMSTSRGSFMGSRPGSILGSRPGSTAVGSRPDSVASNGSKDAPSVTWAIPEDKSAVPPADGPLSANNSAADAADQDLAMSELCAELLVALELMTPDEVVEQQELVLMRAEDAAMHRLMLEEAAKAARAHSRRKKRRVSAAKGKKGKGKSTSKGGGKKSPSKKKKK